MKTKSTKVTYILAWNYPNKKENFLFDYEAGTKKAAVQHCKDMNEQAKRDGKKYVYRVVKKTTYTDVELEFV